jgi:hypothetical protein
MLLFRYGIMTSIPHDRVTRAVLFPRRDCVRSPAGTYGKGLNLGAQENLRGHPDNARESLKLASGLSLFSQRFLTRHSE